MVVIAPGAVGVKYNDQIGNGCGLIMATMFMTIYMKICYSME